MAGRVKPLRAENGNCHRQHPHAHAREIAHVDDIGDRAKRTELRARRNCAEDEGDREAEPCDGGCEV